MSLHPEEVEERKRAFQKLWRERFEPKVSQMHPWYQGLVHEMIKRAYYEGSNHERRKHQLVSVGGAD